MEPVQTFVEKNKMTVIGDHADHTKHMNGKFKHPFLHAPENIDNIHYPDSKTFSVKLNRKLGPAKHPRYHEYDERLI